ncbi:MAG TPA: TetR family transcriptional regulator [Mycobacteriales bacterium]|nr:TetR family transcriptional regulator [Mycobacteriales bacterium]
MVDRRDLTARAVIRDEALRLFAEHGPDAVTIRQIAAAAGVSAGLVVHHFGSKRGLRDAVDAHVGGVFDALFDAFETDDPDALRRLLAGRGGGSLAETLVAGLPPGSPVPAYLRRVLLAGDQAGTRLFRRWYAASQRITATLVAAGVMRPGEDPAVRAAFLMANDLAVLLLRDQLADVLGADPLSAEGLARWFAEALAAYRDGVLTVDEA